MDLFVKKYYEKVYGYIYYNITDKSLAEDVYQSSFEKLWLNYNDRPDEEKLKLWYQIASNEIKKTHNVKVRFNEIITLFAQEQEDDIEEEVELSTENLDDMLSLLSPKEKAAVTLKIWSEYTFKEIAEVMGVSESSVKTYYQRALKKMKENIGENNE